MFRIGVFRIVGTVVGVVIAGVLAGLRIGDEPFWRDEEASVRLATQPLGDLLRTVTVDEANMGPYYLVLHAWMRVSTDPEWVRLLSVVGGMVAIAAIGFLAAEWIGNRAAALAPPLLALHPFFLDYLTEARAYSWAMAAVIVGSVAVSKDRIRWPLYGAAMGLAVALNAVSGLFVLAHVVALAALRARSRAWRDLARGVALAVAVFVPFAWALIAGRREQADWISDLDPVRVASALKDLAGGDLLAIVTAAVLVAYATKALRARKLPSGTVLVLASIAVPIVGLVLVSAVRPLFVDRFLIGVVPFFVLAAADLIARTRRRYLAAGVAAAVLVIGGSPIDEDRPRDASEAESALASIADGSKIRFPHGGLVGGSTRSGSSTTGGCID